jgi:hypothetical protein
MAAIVNAEYEELDEAEIELDLAAENSLPWLESDEDDSDAGALDTRQIILVAVGLLVLGAALLGLLWFATHRINTGAEEPDGSVIAAPEGPIKQRPEDPGGKEFAGTGNVAPLVGEGGTPQAVVASPAKPVPAPTPDPAPNAATGDAAATALQGVGVQLAAYSSRERAEQGWADLARRSESLQGVRHRVVEGQVASGTVYRLQALAATRAEADALCVTLKREGLDCQVKP